MTGKKLPDDFEVLDAPPEVVDELPVYATVPAVKEKAPDAEDPYVILQRNFDAANKSRAEAEERAAIAERRQAELSGEVHKHASSELEAHKSLVQQQYSQAENEIATAETAYADALAAGDYPAAAKIQRAMVRLEGKLTQLENLYENIDHRIKNPPKVDPPQQAAPRDEFEEGLKQLPKPIADWAREHEADLRKRTPLALAAGDLAVKKGLQPGSDAYLDFMDEQMGYITEDTGEAVDVTPKVAAPAPKRRAPPVAAPVSRTQASNPSKVYLTDFDKATARELGLTDREFAVFKRDAPNSPMAKKFGMQTSQRLGGRQ